MLLFIAFLLLAAWLVAQGTRDKNLVKWRSRFERLKPATSYLKKDVKAVFAYARAWPARIKDRKDMRRLLKRVRRLKEI